MGFLAAAEPEKGTASLTASLIQKGQRILMFWTCKTIPAWRSSAIPIWNPETGLTPPNNPIQELFSEST